MLKILDGFAYCFFFVVSRQDNCNSVHNISNKRYAKKKPQTIFRLVEFSERKFKSLYCCDEIVFTNSNSFPELLVKFKTQCTQLHPQFSRIWAQSKLCWRYLVGDRKAHLIVTSFPRVDINLLGRSGLAKHNFCMSATDKQPERQPSIWAKRMPRNRNFYLLGWNTFSKDNYNFIAIRPTSILFANTSPETPTTLSGNTLSMPTKLRSILFAELSRFLATQRS